MAEDEILAADELEGSEKPKVKEHIQEPWQIFEGSKIAVSKAVGPVWKERVQEAIKAYEHVYDVWEEVFRYYNNDQASTNETQVGAFKRGDATENVLYSNINTLIPAAYGKDPDVACHSSDKAEEEFTETLQSLLNTLIKRRSAPGINLKPKAKRAALYGELTNFGVLKLSYQQKGESREQVTSALTDASQRLAKAKNKQEVEKIYGELQALEATLVVSEPMGPKVTNVLPHNLIIDPTAEQQDGLDGTWMAERTWLPTEFLNAKFTRKGKDGQELVYKPTHKMEFKSKKGSGDDDESFTGILSSLHNEERTELPTSYTYEERLAYLNQYLTEVYYVWDKTTRRVFLFDGDDWAWPIWVWDDPLQLSRFFPYYIFSVSQNTGGPVGVGETAYYLDQQDEINEINREIARIRRIVFRFFFYNSNSVDPEDAEKLNNALSGNMSEAKRLYGIDIPEGMSIKDMIESVAPPSVQYEALFNKAPAYSVVDKLSGNNDALRGAQFKANTTEDAVQAYMSAARIRIGARTDAIEDALSDLLFGLAELCVQFMTIDEVAALIGKTRAQHWYQMSTVEFNATTSVHVVAGSTEKPTSQFKKKEAIQVAQAIGQFAAGAPVATFKIALKVLEKAFPGEVVIHADDWDALDKEMAAQMQRGVSTGAPTPTQQNKPSVTQPRSPLPSEAQNAP